MNAAEYHQQQLEQQEYEETEMTESTFEQLAALNVNDHTESKNGFTYLSWAWAHDQMARLDADFEWGTDDFPADSEGVVKYPYLATPAGCFVRVWVKFKGRTLRHTYPVIDHRNKAIAATDVDAMNINTAQMRAFAKCCALHGLGLYIYAGEDLPQAPDVSSMDAHKIILTGGKYEGISLGDLATKCGMAGLGHLQWMSIAERNPALREKAKEVWEKHRPELADADIEDMIADADNLDELMGIWRCMSDEQQDALKPQFTARKEELTPEKRDAAEARG